MSSNGREPDPRFDWGSHVSLAFQRRQWKGCIRWMQPFFLSSRTSINWCGRSDLNRHRPCGPTDFLTPSAFAAAQHGRSWSGLSLHRGVAALGAARLVSTPSRLRAWLGITSKGFPEFEQFYIGDFSPCTQMLKSGASTIPPRPHTAALIDRGENIANPSVP